MSYEYRLHRLANGLTILAECSPAAHTAAGGFFVRTGARDEPREIMGVSHFLEHMMFKGCAGLSAEQLNRAFDEIGARNNAYTSNEITCFYADALPEQFPRALELLGRMMRPTLAPEEFEVERGVILEEIAMYHDNPFWVLFEETLERHFGNHPVSHRVLGTPQTIGAMRAEQMRAYFDARYSPDNTVVALAGNVDFEAACRQLEALTASWSPTRADRDPRPPAIAGGTFELRSEKVTQAYVLAMCPAPAMADDRRYAASILAHVLGGGDNSRLHWSLIEPGIADDAQASFDPHDGLGDFMVFATLHPARVDEAWEILEREMRTLSDSLEPADLERLREKMITSATINGERPHDRMQRLGRLWTYLGRYATLEEELAMLSGVTLDNLRALRGEFPVRPVTVGRLLPAG
ncbi:MAG: pitrilysin family protein [Planctomycetota bacterium]|nr:pitrilysin family protein [Planctomycetota bacterium]